MAGPGPWVGGRGRADWGVVEPLVHLEAGWSHAGWRALEETWSPEDPPHLEVTQAMVRAS